MLDCPRCAAPLPLTSPSCACGADVRSAAEGVGLACEACDGWNPAGTSHCAGCGAALGAEPDLPTLDLELADEELDEAAPPGAEREHVAESPGAEREHVAEPPVAEREHVAEPPRAEQEAEGAEVVQEPEPSPDAAPTPPRRPEPPPGPPILQRAGRARGGAIHQALPAGPAALRVRNVRPDGSTATVLLGASPVVCGRSDADLVVPGGTVSRHHARFGSRDGHPFVEDLGSLNGTWIRLRAPRAIAYGDELRIGERRLRLAYTPDGAAVEEIATGGATLAVHPLRAGTTVIGSAGDLRLEGAEARHARIEATCAGHAVVDLGSRTGTWLRLAAPEPVAAGDELLLGAERLRIDDP